MTSGGAVPASAALSSAHVPLDLAREEVNAPLDVVWSTFVDLPAWEQWSRTIRLLTGAGQEFRRGARYVFEVAADTPRQTEVEVLECRPPLRVVWVVTATGWWRGFEAVTEYDFASRVRPVDRAGSAGPPTFTLAVCQRRIQHRQVTATSTAEMVTASANALARFLAEFRAECERRAAP